MRIGIFGGSFNPVHLGHVALVVHLIEAKQLDQVYILPVNMSPFKTDQHLLDGKERIHLCRLAFKGVPKCKVLATEVKRGGVSYTIDTLNELLQKGYVSKQDSLFLLLGQDSLQGFANWKSKEQIVEMAEIVVASRGNSAKVETSVSFIETPLFDVSATEIRQRLKKKLYCGHLLNKTVYKYIQKKSLYLKAEDNNG